MANGPAYTWARAWPTWVLAVVAIAGALTLALYGRLDDWLRAAFSVLFAACAGALIARAVEARRRRHDT